MDDYKNIAQTLGQDAVQKLQQEPDPAKSDKEIAMDYRARLEASREKFKKGTGDAMESYMGGPDGSEIAQKVMDKLGTTNPYLGAAIATAVDSAGALHGVYGTVKGMGKPNLRLVEPSMGGEPVMAPYEKSGAQISGEQKAAAATQSKAGDTINMRQETGNNSQIIQKASTPEELAHNSKVRQIVRDMGPQVASEAKQMFGQAAAEAQQSGDPGRKAAVAEQMRQWIQNRLSGGR